MTNHIRTVLFDLDGTLADTAPDLAHALNTLLVEEGKKALPYETIRPEASHGRTALIKHRIPERPHHTPLNPPYLGIFEMVSSHSRGRCRRCS